MKYSMKIVSFCMLLIIAVAQANAADTVTVMVVATPVAVTKLGGPVAALHAVKTDIENINRSFGNSKIDGYIKLVRTDLFNDAPPLCMVDLLNEVVTVRQPASLQLSLMRSECSADIVIIIVDEPTTCGLSGEYRDASQAYIVLNYKCLGRNSSMARQLGYLLGCGNHESESGRFNPFNDNALAYFYEDEDDESKSFSTIMAYTDERISSNEPDFNLINYWSTPDRTVLYMGKPVGDATHDNAAQIRQALKFVSRYKEEYGMLTTIDTRVRSYNMINMASKRELNMVSLNLEAESMSEMRSKKVRLSGNGRIAAGATARFVGIKN